MTVRNRTAASAGYRVTISGKTPTADALRAHGGTDFADQLPDDGIFTTRLAAEEFAAACARRFPSDHVEIHEECPT